MYRITRYTNEKKDEWNNFVSNAKNATFLFQREFMDYHNDRFEDYSLLIFNNKKLIALLPANFNNEVIYSHQGLTYGGLLLHKNSMFDEVLVIFKELLLFLENKNFITFHLKLLPKIYNLLGSDEIDYLLFKLKAKNTRKDITSVILLQNKLPIRSSNRKRGIKKAIKNNLIIKEENNLEGFWNEILIPNLLKTHNATPVHTLAEIISLKSKFQNNIKQFNVYSEENLLAGITIFETKVVAHVQYISANVEGKNLRSLDFLVNYLINEKYTDKKYFDFGISNENQGQQVNQGLINWKESFGARSIVHDFYEINTSNHHLLNDIFI